MTTAPVSDGPTRALGTGLWVWLAAVAIAMVPGAAKAERPASPELGADGAKLPPGERGSIIITGTRANRRAVEVPYSVSVLARTELERRLPRTVPEALRQLPGVLVQKTASGHGSPYIRGFTGNRTLLVIDGIRYNNATFRDGANEYFAQVDSFTLDQVELIAGPSSALYGAEAVGGVINLATRASGMAAKSGRFASAEQITRVSSGDRSLVSRSAIDVGTGGQWGLRAGVTLREYGDIRAAGLGRLRETGYWERAANARLDLSLAPDWTATINHQSLWQDDVPRTHSTFFSVPFAGTVAGDDQLREKDHRRNLTYARLSGVTGSAAFNSFELTLSHQARREDELRLRGDLVEIDQGFTSDLFAASAVITGDWAGLALTYGFDLSREYIDSARQDTDRVTGTVTRRLQGPVGTDARYDQAGAFIHSVFELGDGFSLEASARASFVKAVVGQFADPVTGEAISFADGYSDFSGSLRAMRRWGSQRFWGAYSRSFRAPNIADISRFGRSRSSEIEVASLTLGTEKFDTFELGYGYGASGLDLTLTAYTTALIDYIATVPTGEMRGGLTEVAKRNVASGRVSGVEFNGSARLTDPLSLAVNATWLRGRLTRPGVSGPIREPLTRIQPLSGNLALNWEQGSSWASLELGVFGRADELSAGDIADVERIPPGGTPGYALLNLRLGFELSPRITITGELNNIFDEAYRSHGSGNNEPGRHAVFSLRMDF